MSRYKSYPEYKDSGVEWIGEVPAHWEVVSLRRHATYQNSNVDKKSNEGEEPVRLCNYTDVYYNEFINSDGSYMEATASREEIARFRLRVNDVVITKDSEDPEDIAVPALITHSQDDFVCGYHLTIIRSGDDAAQRFLHRLFDSLAARSYFFQECPGVTRFGLNQNAIGAFTYGLPPKEEMRQITIFLNRETTRIDTLVEKKQRFIELLEEKRQAVITHAVTKGLDPNVPMKDSGVEWIGAVPAHWEVVKCFHAGVQIYTGRVDVNIQSPNGVYPFFTCGREIKHTDQYSFDCEAILVAGNGEVGYTHYYKGKFEAYQRVYVLTNLSEFNPQFLVYYFKANLMRALESKAVGSVIQFITLGDLRHFRIAHPDQHAQSQIAAFLDRETARIDSLVDKTRQSIELLKERRSALIMAAVTGKIDVREEAA